jgi:hypothetical protein
MPAILKPLRGPRGYRTRLKPSERDAALAAGRDLYARTARRLGLWSRVRRGTATDADRRRIVERLSLDARHEVAGLAGRLLDGSLGRDAWHRRTRELLPARYYAGVLAALGSQFSDDDWAFALSEVARQLAYLKRFNIELGTGEQAFDGRVWTRADHYGAAVWATAQNALLRRAIADGYTQARRVLGPADHCTGHGGLLGCIEQARLGWRPIKAVRPIGDSPCYSRCHCRFEVRK